MILCLSLVIDYQSLLLTDWSCVQARVPSRVIGRGWRSDTGPLAVLMYLLTYSMVQSPS